MKPSVEFRNISKSYDNQTLVIRDLNLSIERGEFLTLLGPSGSGKTTALMMLAGFEMPTTGEIFVEGQPYSALPAHKRDIGVVFQNYALFPHMSVAENIAFPLQVRGHGPKDLDRRVKAALDMVRLPEISARKPAQLSGGQQQRVALARALVYEPKIVLMDEPLGALDRQLREEMQIEIKSIHARVGVTFVYVTHDQGEALTMSDRVAIFRKGVIEQIADPQTLYDRPCNAFVATFIGDSNLLRGTIVGRGGGQATVAMPGGGTLDARAGDNGAGKDAYVSVRPEKIDVSAGCIDRGVGNILAGTVDKTVFFGDHVKVSIRLEGGQLLAVKTGTTEPYKNGQTVTASWRAEDCVAFTAPPTRDTAVVETTVQV
ncbi:ABC transporter ATP-binding protein [Oryzicola mucosus]|uniref:Spermidine/putrescine import ATP-binding protein PotA n=1 Tax=Oryzicola mucosus TaxID=2767425 RepID=A0A8J6PR57_9HYPH|nr:ABC transporter ATP-binding protein [Oryzicola mucosus]MBD0417442.1 ABC transporter ATP-binding protein [Oryzicola mucosus]